MMNTSRKKIMPRKNAQNSPTAVMDSLFPPHGSRGHRESLIEFAMLAKQASFKMRSTQCSAHLVPPDKFQINKLLHVMSALRENIKTNPVRNALTVLWEPIRVNEANLVAKNALHSSMH